MAMKVGDYEVTQEIVDKLTVWACTTAGGFTLAQLSGQAHRSRVAPDYSAVVARRLITKWKNEGKLNFERGRWKWVA